MQLIQMFSKSFREYLRTSFIFLYTFFRNMLDSHRRLHFQATFGCRGTNGLSALFLPRTAVRPSVLRRQRSSASPLFGRILSTSYKCLVRPAEFSLETVRLLSFCVHLFVVLLVVAAGNVVHPLLIVEVPTYSFLNAFFELQ